MCFIWGKTSIKLISGRIFFYQKGRKWNEMKGYLDRLMDDKMEYPPSDRESWKYKVMFFKQVQGILKWRNKMKQSRGGKTSQMRKSKRVWQARRKRENKRFYSFFLYAVLRKSTALNVTRTTDTKPINTFCPLAKVTGSEMAHDPNWNNKINKNQY